ncbi:hypothetical protein K0M31_012581 [Melipona bicolor]|uniref:Uncharacterized protein n=1 Tax=Melipona bicolor TaxID=60889 RepID=A0AA40KH85_9HYME|nr:hypothetical protein K0M31_012581 [Melipona bicolor]
MATSAIHSRTDGGYNETKMADTYQLRDDMAAIQYQLAEMTHKMATMETNLSRRRPFHRQPRFRDRRSQSRGRPSSSRQYKTTGELCYYHFNFGARAHKCKNPCNWSSVIAEVAQQSEN